MNRIREHSFENTDDMLDFLRDSASSGFTWYRGQGDSNWSLSPQVYRREGGDEFGLLRSFQQKSSSFVSAPGSDDIAHWISVAQHNGLPTRVLDWSESFLVALFFAATRTSPPADHSDDASSMAVWLLNPVALNQHVMGGEKVRLDDGQVKRVGVCSESDEAMLVNMLALFGIDYPGTRHPFVAYSPAFRHARMFSQKAAFTWHEVAQPLEQFEGAEKFLRKVVFPAGVRDRLLSDLTLLGITHSTLFPDFDGVAQELKRKAWALV